MDKNVSVVIPAFNEENGIGTILDSVKNVLAANNFTYELLVVNDGSTDRTGEVARKKGAKVITHTMNQGYGASIKAGVQHAAHGIILITDGDGTYPADKIPELLEGMRDSPMVVGSRIGRNIKVPLIRRPAKWALTKLASYLSESPIDDLNSGLRAIDKAIFNNFKKILPDGFSLTTTITLAMLCNGYSVKYIPITYNRRIGKSKIRPIRDTLNFLQLILRTVLLFNPLKVFIPASLLLFFAAFFIFFYSFFFLPFTMDVTAIVLLMGGIQILAIGMIADLINRRLG